MEANLNLQKEMLLLTQNKRNIQSISNQLAVEEYNNFGEPRNSYSIASNYESKCKGIIENIISNRNTVIEILSNKGSFEEKQLLLKKILDDYDPLNKQYNEDNKHLKENQGSTSAIEHTKSMGVVDESHDSLLFDDEPNKNLKEKMDSHHSFHKRPLSQNNMLRSKSSRQKRRK